MLQFSASAKSNPLAGRKQSPENLFTAAEETLIEWEEVRAKNLLFARVTAMFTKKSKPMMRVFLMCIVPLSLVATEQQNLSERTDQSLSAQDKRLAALETSCRSSRPLLRNWSSNCNRKTAAKIIASARRAVTHRQAPDQLLMEHKN